MWPILNIRFVCGSWFVQCQITISISDALLTALEALGINFNGIWIQIMNPFSVKYSWKCRLPTSRHVCSGFNGTNGIFKLIIKPEVTMLIGAAGGVSGDRYTNGNENHQIIFLHRREIILVVFFAVYVSNWHLLLVDVPLRFIIILTISLLTKRSKLWMFSETKLCNNFEVGWYPSNFLRLVLDIHHVMRSVDKSICLSVCLSVSVCQSGIDRQQLPFDGRHQTLPVV